MAMAKLFLLDAMALIYRAHFAFSKVPRVTSKGLSTGAAFGFTNTLLEILNKEKPTHIGVAFDTAAPTFRHEAFEAYKAQRQEQPEDITLMIPYVKEIIRAFNIPVYEMPGFEADDIIGALAKKAEKLGWEVFMMTPDKDYCQLVSPLIKVYKPAFLQKGPEILGVDEVCERWEITSPDQVRDILGLMGDASDNIPGVPGIGEKTAKKLIAEYHSLENLLQNTSQLKGKMKENLEQFAQQGIESKQLATIHIETPVELDPEALERKEANKDAVRKVFEELEFKTLLARVLGKEQGVSFQPTTSSSGQISLFGGSTGTQTAAIESDNETESDAYNTSPIKNAGNTLHYYHIMDSEDLRLLLASYLEKQPAFCFDTETNALSGIDMEAVGISISWEAGTAYYVPLSGTRAERAALLAPFKASFEDDSKTKVGQNLKYDLGVLHRYGIEVKGPLWDTMLAHYLLEPDMRHNMDYLAKTYLNYEPISIEELIGKKGRGQQQGSMEDVELPIIAEYAAEDADITWQLYKVFEPKIKELNLENLLLEVEGKLIPVLAAMEQEGCMVDTKALVELSDLLGEEAQKVEFEVYNLAGEKFNINSTQQLGYILFDKLKLDSKAKKTKTGKYATNEEVLQKLALEDIPIAELILSYREFIKLKSTYVDNLPDMIDKADMRVHTTYNQAVAATGRLSSTQPNLQNIPIRTSRGKEIRKAFVPRDSNHLILSADYSQIELRIMAAFSGDATMIQAFKEDKDIHAITASRLNKVPLEQVDSEMRRRAKTANFGIIYGISAFGLSQRLNIPRAEAKEIIDNYFKEFSAVKEYMDRVINEARENGFVQTILGRRRWLPNLNSRNQTERGFAERNAINAPIQGSAADMIKVAMIHIHDWLKQEKLKTKMILQVHDELVFDAHKDEVEYIKAPIIQLMKEAIPLSVPMEVGLGTGKNWLEAH